MRICVDVQSAVTQRAGVGRYTRQLVENLAPLMQEDVLRLFHFDFARGGTALEIPGTEARRVRWCPGRVAQLAWKKVHWPPFDLFAGAADLYHFPNFTIPPLSRGRSVVTIHDMSFFRHPEFAEARNLRHLTGTIHRTAERADAILTISHFSGREIQELLRVPGDRVFPVYLGISPVFCQPSEETVTSTLARLELRRPYLLTVGTLEPRKNIPFLVEVFEHMHDFDGELVIAGMPGWQCEPILRRIRESSRADDIRFIQYVGDGALPSLYAGADLFVLTSFYEGFGFPPLEAMACGTPALTSRGGSLAEVVGDAGVTLGEFDADLWSSTACDLLGDTERRKELREKGIAHAARYTWQETARQTLEVYREVTA